MRGLIRAFYVITHMFSITLEVFLRRRFGERYLHSLHVMLALGLAALYVFYRQIKALFNGEAASWAIDWTSPMSVAAMLFLALSLWHLLVIQLRLKRGEEWHSKSSGDSWLYFDSFPIQQQTFQRFVEPAFCFWAGSFFTQPDSPLGFWIMFASACMFIKGQIEYQRSRELQLDRLDSEFESGRRVLASQNVVTLALFPPVQGMVGLKEYYKALPLALQNIIQQVPEVKYEYISAKYSNVPHQDTFDQKPLYDRIIGDRVYILFAKMVFWLPLVSAGVIVLLNLIRGLFPEPLPKILPFINIYLAFLGALALPKLWDKNNEIIFASDLKRYEEYFTFENGLTKKYKGVLWILFILALFCIGMAYFKDVAIFKYLTLFVLQIFVFLLVLAAVIEYLTGKSSDRYDFLALPIALQIIRDHEKTEDKYLTEREAWLRKTSLSLFNFSKIIFFIPFIALSFSNNAFNAFSHGVENELPDYVEILTVSSILVSILALFAAFFLSLFYIRAGGLRFQLTMLARPLMLGMIFGVLLSLAATYSLIFESEKTSDEEFGIIGLTIVGAIVLFILVKVVSKLETLEDEARRKRFEKYLEKNPNDTKARDRLEKAFSQIYLF